MWDKEGNARYVVMIAVLVLFTTLSYLIGRDNASQFYCAKNDPALKEYRSCLREFKDD